MLELPTGSGKSLVQALLIQRILREAPGNRILCLTHVKELIGQNHDELMTIWLDAPAGIYSAGLGRRDTDHPVIFASIQSVHKRAAELGQFSVIFIDESHMVSPNGTTMYRAFIDALTLIQPMLRVIGLTATPYRLNGGMLHLGDNALFDDLITAKKLGCTLPALIDAGHLAPLVTPTEALPQLSTDGIGKSGGDYRPGQLADAIEAQREVTEQACAEIVRLGGERKCWIVFCASVAHCRQAEEILAFDYGIDCAVVVGETPADERAESIADLKAGRLRCLISVNVLSTGFNVRQVDLLAMLRPTASTSLYVQQAGRGMRTYPGKTDCLVLDFAGNIDAHGPVDDVRPPKPPKGKGGGEAVQKECDACLMLIAAGCLTCPHCGHQFPKPEIDISHKPSTRAIIGRTIEDYPITDATYRVHKKPGKPDSVRVDYISGIRFVASEWVCLWHTGYARDKAHDWWRTYVGTAVPATPDDAVQACKDQARVPSNIKVDVTDKYPRILKVTA